MAQKTNTILFTGKARESLRSALSKWISVFGEKYGDSGISRIGVGEATPEVLRGELLSLPFLVEKRLVILDGLPFEKPSSDESAKKTLEASPKAIESLITELFDSIPDDVFVVFVSSEPHPGSDLAKFLKSKATIKEFTPPSITNARETLKEHLPALPTKSVNLLMTRIGENPERFEHALRKLELFSDETLWKSDIIDEVLPDQVEESVFTLSDALLSGRINAALATLENLRSIYPLREVFAPLVGAIRTALYIDRLRETKKSDAEIAKMAWIHPFVLSKRPRLTDAERKRLLRVFSLLIDLEIGSKTGTMPGETDEDTLHLGISRAIFAWKSN